MAFESILAGVIAITGFVEGAVAFDLRVRRAPVLQYAALLPFVGACVFFGLWVSLWFGFYSGPDPHGADLAEARVAAVNLALGGVLVLILRSGGFSAAARRCVFYAFTVPAWTFLFSLAWRGLRIRLAQ